SGSVSPISCKKHCNFAENIFVQIFFHLTLYIEREIKIILWCELDVVFHVPGDRKLREQKMLLTLQTTWNVEQEASQHCRNRKKKLLFQEEGSFFLCLFAAKFLFAPNRTNRFQK
ncbi:hypothetical protein, partial [Ruminococcus callidus]